MDRHPGLWHSTRLIRSRRLNILLAISHPDDDAIFAGALQRWLGGHAWSVVCVTSHPDEPRGRELLDWQARLGTPRERIHFLGEPDDPEDYRQGRCSLCPDRIVAALREHTPRPDLVVTHNVFGEYGHPHHAATHRAAAQAFPRAPRLEFGHGQLHADLELACADKWPAVAECYASQERVIAKLAQPTETFCWAASGGRVRIPGAQRLPSRRRADRAAQ